MASNQHFESLSDDHNSMSYRAEVSFSQHPLKFKIGRAVQFISVVGIILGFLGILLVPIFAARFSSWVDESTITFSEETAQIADSLRQAGSLLTSGMYTLESTETAIQSIKDSIEDTESLIDSTATLIGDQAPSIIDDTRSALLSAEEGARAVDQVLRGLAKINFLTGVTYDPAQPLDEAIAEVADSLEPLPDDLRRVGEGLSQTHSNLEEMGLSLSGASDEVNGFSEELSDKNELLTDLATDLDALSEDIVNARGSIRSVLWISVIIFELLMIVHIAGQSAIYYVGGEMASHPPES